jgi:hypothetical protein
VTSGEERERLGVWAVALRWSRIVGNELQNFGAGWAYALRCFFINIDSGEVEVEWNQQLWKC